jgi:hypothetical protein
MYRVKKRVPQNHFGTPLWRQFNFQIDSQLYEEFVCTYRPAAKRLQYSSIAPLMECRLNIYFTGVPSTVHTYPLYTAIRPGQSHHAGKLFVYGRRYSTM